MDGIEVPRGSKQMMGKSEAVWIVPGGFFIPHDKLLLVMIQVLK